MTTTATELEQPLTRQGLRRDRRGVARPAASTTTPVPTE